MNKIILFIIILITSSKYIKAQGYYMCFETDNNKIAISIKYSETHAVSVKYRGQTESIQLALHNEKFITKSPEGTRLMKPTIVEIYKEIHNNKITGQYTITKSGNMYDVVYIRYSDNKKFLFNLNSELTFVDGTFRDKECY